MTNHLAQAALVTRWRHVLFGDYGFDQDPLRLERFGVSNSRDFPRRRRNQSSVSGTSKVPGKQRVPSSAAGAAVASGAGPGGAPGLASAVGTGEAVA